jgi:hypothetical protein
VANIDLAQASQDRLQADYRLEQFPDLYSHPRIKPAWDALHDRIAEELRQLNDGVSREQIAKENEAAGADLVGELVRAFEEMHAFSVPATYWAEYQDNPKFLANLSQIADYFNGHGALWGKAGQAEGQKKAVELGYDILEGRPPALAMNGLNFGVPNGYAGYPPTLKTMWDKFPEAFVRPMYGEVLVNTFRTMAADGVLATIEIPALLERMKNDQSLTGIRVHELAMNPQNGNLETAKSFLITNRTDFEKLPKEMSDARSPSFITQQNVLHHRGDERRLAMNQLGLQGSMPHVKKGMDQEPARWYVVTGPDQLFFSDSSQEISRKHSFATAEAERLGPEKKLKFTLAVLQRMEETRAAVGSPTAGSPSGPSRMGTFESVSSYGSNVSGGNLEPYPSFELGQRAPTLGADAQLPGIPFIPANQSSIRSAALAVTAAGKLGNVVAGKKSETVNELLRTTLRTGTAPKAPARAR